MNSVKHKFRNETLHHIRNEMTSGQFPYISSVGAPSIVAIGFLADAFNTGTQNALTNEISRLLFKQSNERQQTSQECQLT